MKRYRLFLFLLLSSCIACTQFDEEVMPNVPATTRASVNAAALRASAATANADNPYSVDNMEAAMIQYCKFANISPRPIRATHEYVRFEVRDSLDYYILDDSLGLELFTYPLDRMLNNSERDFYSNDIIDGKQWYYTVVPKNYRYPAEVERQVLQDIYMQGDVIISGPHATSGTSGSNSLDESLYDTVLELSMKNAGIGVDSGPSATAKWVPSARILYTDDLTDETVPLKNVTVRVNTFVNIGTGRTNENGEVEIPKGWGGKFRNPVNYEVKFKNDRFKLIENKTGVAIAYGPTKSKSQWLYTITSDDKRVSAFAAVHWAAYHIFYVQNDITTPHALGKYRIAVYWDQYLDALGWHSRGKNYLGCFANPIEIAGRDIDNIYCNRYEIIGTTFHELAHASHWTRNPCNMNDADKTVKESYARAIELYFWRKNYPGVNQDVYRPGFFTVYTGVGDALYHNGFSIQNIQKLFTDFNNRNYTDLLNNALSMKLMYDWMVKLLFAYPYCEWNFRLLTESIETNDDEYVVYKDVPITLQLHETLRHSNKVNATVKNWTAIPSGSETVSETGTSAIFKFNKEGTYTVTAEIKIPEVDNTYMTSRNITVRQPSITGPSTPRLGVLYDYQLTNNRAFQTWSLEYLDKDGNWVDGKDNVFRTITNDRTMLRLIFHTFGTYRIIAHFNINGKQTTTMREINVQAEGRATSEYHEPGIYPVRAYKHNTTGAIVHQMNNRIFTRVLTGYTALLDTYNFRTFSHDVTSNHPYAGKLRPIYKMQYDGYVVYSPLAGAFASGPITESWVKFITVSSSTLAFYVLTSQQFGTVPIYSVEMTIKDSSGTIKSKCRYLSLQRLDGVRTVDDDQYFYRTIESLGYVYPMK